jgi:hypothetical protein
MFSAFFRYRQKNEQTFIFLTVKLLSNNFSYLSLRTFNYYL